LIDAIKYSNVTICARLAPQAKVAIKCYQISGTDNVWSFPAIKFDQD